MEFSLFQSITSSVSRLYFAFNVSITIWSIQVNNREKKKKNNKENRTKQSIDLIIYFHCCKLYEISYLFTCSITLQIDWLIKSLFHWVKNFGKTTTWSKNQKKTTKYQNTMDSMEMRAIQLKSLLLICIHGYVAQLWLFLFSVWFWNFNCRFGSKWKKQQQNWLWTEKEHDVLMLFLPLLFCLPDIGLVQYTFFVNIDFRGLHLKIQS